MSSTIPGPAIRSMTIDDYDAVAALWQACPGVGLSDSDTREGVGRFIERNPGTSLVALDGDAVVGAVLCGHDGRRGDLELPPGKLNLMELMIKFRKTV